MSYTAENAVFKIGEVLDAIARELESPHVSRSQTLGKLHRAADAIREIDFNMLKDEKDYAIPEDLQQVVATLYHVFGDL